MSVMSCMSAMKIRVLGPKNVLSLNTLLIGCETDVAQRTIQWHGEYPAFMRRIPTRQSSPADRTSTTFFSS